MVDPPYVLGRIKGKQIASLSKNESRAQTAEKVNRIEQEVLNGLARLQRSIEASRRDFDRVDGRGSADTSHITRQITVLQEQQVRLASRLPTDAAARVLENFG